MNEQYTKGILDTIVGGGAVSSPWWMTYLQTGVTVFMLLGGAALLGIRLAIAWREWRNQKK